MSTSPVVSLIGDSPRMRDTRALLGRIARSREPVLVQGPTGSGKELVAQALHAMSGRDGRMVAFNVCAIPDTMFEDTLFGHVRGAFTGAATDSPGLLAEANGGTAFFDEIGGLPLALQVKLLRAIETGVFRPVGAKADRRSDFRIVAATNEPLSSLLEGGRFRSDLAFRLRTFCVELPPLRQRAEDIPALVEHFEQTLWSPGVLRQRFTSCAMRALQGYDWPGNVRELRSVVVAAMTLVDSSVIDGPAIVGLLHERGAPLSDAGRADHQRRQLLDLLNSVEWNTTAAAHRLGVDRATVYRRMEAYGIPTLARATRSREGMRTRIDDGQRSTLT